MKIKILLLLLITVKVFSQNIKCEETSYEKNFKNFSYSSFHYINSSYSSSRPYIIFICDKKDFEKTRIKVPSLFKKKQEYTDIYIIGVDYKYFSIDDEEILLKEYLNSIEAYRKSQSIPLKSKPEILKIKNYSEMCKFLNCSK